MNKLIFHAQTIANFSPSPQPDISIKAQKNGPEFRPDIFYFNFPQQCLNFCPDPHGHGAFLRASPVA
jgi:hypothetical protein